MVGVFVRGTKVATSRVYRHVRKPILNVDDETCVRQGDGWWMKNPSRQTLFVS
uniref:Uncharacterized protein n=1 Tax=Physcomitrium patens TaxID=3218 RepID=A0A2K1J7Y9_PHYPA|nr:hypothetical protein PHYPA_020745 [Physcomitrium patens]